VSDIKANSIRMDDEWVLSVKVQIGDNPRRYGVIEFLPHTEVLSVCQGSIYHNKIMFTNEKNIEVCLDYPYESKTLECIITYVSSAYTYDSLKVSIEEHSPIIKETVEQTGHCAQMTANLSLSTDILVEVTNPRSTWVAFGENTECIVASDFLTPINPDHPNFIIPIEVLWNKAEQYIGADVGIFELIKIHPIEHMFSKRLVSNVLKLSDFPKRCVQTSFVSPVGIALGDKHG